MKLIVGLGNPGDKYEGTRHNVGFGLVNYYCQKNNITLNKEKFNGLFFLGNGFIIAKPLTFMNLSGDFVQAITKFYKIDPSDVLILADDMNVQPGNLLMKPTGGSGGQNGVGDIIAKLGTKNIARLKIGIGRKPDAIKHVLGRVSKSEYTLISGAFEKAANAIDAFINVDVEKAMLTSNTK